MSNIKKFAEFVNESLNEAELPSWVGNGPYESLEDMFGIIGDDIQNADGSELTAADVNNNYKPALKYLGVRSIDDMGMIANSIDDDGMYDGADAIDKQMKSSNFLGNDGGKGMNTNPYTAAYKGKVGDIKVIIVQDINGENSYVYAATKGGKLKESLNESTELNEAILGPTYLQDVRELIMEFGDDFEPSEIIKGAKSMEKELMKTVKLAIKDLVDYKKDELEESLNEGKEDKIAKEYDAGTISRLDMDDFPNAKEIEKLSSKFNYIINAMHVSDNDQDWDSFMTALKKDRIKFAKIQDTVDGDEQILF